MYIYHPRGVFKTGFGWFAGKSLQINTHIFVYNILFTDGITDYDQGLIQTVFDICLPI